MAVDLSSEMMFNSFLLFKRFVVVYFLGIFNVEVFGCGSENLLSFMSLINNKNIDKPYITN